MCFNIQARKNTEMRADFNLRDVPSPKTSPPKVKRAMWHRQEPEMKCLPRMQKINTFPAGEALKEGLEGSEHWEVASDTRSGRR